MFCHLHAHTRKSEHAFWLFLAGLLFPRSLRVFQGPVVSYFSSIEDQLLVHIQLSTSTEAFCYGHFANNLILSQGLTKLEKQATIRGAKPPTKPVGSVSEEFCFFGSFFAFDFRPVPLVLLGHYYHHYYILISIISSWCVGQCTPYWF